MLRKSIYLYVGFVFLIFAIGCGGGGKSSGGASSSTTESGSGVGNVNQGGEKKSEEAPKVEEKVEQQRQEEQQEEQQQGQQQEQQQQEQPEQQAEQQQPVPQGREPVAEEEPEADQEQQGGEPVAEAPQQEQPPQEVPQQPEPEPEPVAEDPPAEQEAEPIVQVQPEPQPQDLQPEPQQQADAEPAYIEDPDCWANPDNFCVQILPASGSLLSRFGEIFVVFSHPINTQSVVFRGTLGEEANNRVWEPIDEPNERLILRPPQEGWAIGPAQILELRGTRSGDGRILGRISATFQVRDSTVFVATDGNDANPGSAEQPKQTIQAGIQLAAQIGQNSEVHVAQGEYRVNAQMSAGKAIHIAFRLRILGGFNRGNWSERDPRRFETLIIDESNRGGGERNPLAVFYAENGSQSIVDGFTIQAGSGDFTAAIFTDNNTRTVFSNNVLLLGGATDTAYGIYSQVNFDLEFRDNVIRHRQSLEVAPLRQYGIFVRTATHTVVLQGNQVELGPSRRNYGIYLNDAPRTTILGNRITLSGETAYGLYCENCGGAWMQNQIFVGGDQGETFGLYLFNAARSTTIASNWIEGRGRIFTGIHLINNPELFIFSNTLNAGESETNYALSANSSDFSFYNNLVYAGSGQQTYGMALSNGSQALVRNNTIHGGRGTQTAQAIFLYTQGVGNNFLEARIENNILMAEGSGRSYCLHEPFIPNELHGATPVSFKYNDLFACTIKYYDADGRCVANDDQDRDVRTCSIQAVNNRLRDITDGSVGNVSEDPLFVDFRGADGNPGTLQDNDWHLSGGAPRAVREEGLNGDTLQWGFNDDKDGSLRSGRPNGRGWSMGAFEKEEEVAAQGN